MSHSNSNQWATELSAQLRGLDAGRRWTVLAGALCIALGILAHTVGWGGEATAAPTDATRKIADAAADANADADAGTPNF